MNNNLASIEAHIQYVTTKQLQDALAHEQLKLAKANRTGITRTAVAKMRLSIGTMLISLGERLQAEHARQAQREAERRHQARTQTA